MDHKHSSDPVIIYLVEADLHDVPVPCALMNNLSIEAPVVVEDSSENKMEDAEYEFQYRWAEKECNENVRLFREGLRVTDPNGLEPGHVAKYHDEWYGKLEEYVECY